MTEQRAKTTDVAVAQLIDLLDVEQIDVDLYRGARQPGGVGRVFGGQVIAQALQAAQRSIGDEKTAHSLHAYFLRGGDEGHPIVFRVVRDFEGRSFANRRVIATQQGKPILNMAASFQLPEDGVTHQDAMPDVTPPEDLKNETELFGAVADRIPAQFRDFALRARPIELRPVRPRQWFSTERAEPLQHCWMRLALPVAHDPVLHRAMLAYASDMLLLGTATLPHGMHWMTGNLQSASLDHALWFHEEVNFNDWLLYSCDSPWAGHGRGFNRGKIFSRDGRLIASASQEGVVRERR
jgi:acyl-CoA thioesterase-2